MHTRFKALAGALLCAGLITPAHANPELEALRAEIAQMKRQYEARLKELEERLKAAEGQAAVPPAAGATPQAGADRLGALSSGSAFNPQISVIFDGVYYRDNKRGEGPHLYEHLDGINHSHGHAHAHGIERGFNLRSTELVFAATVDPWFDAQLMLTVDAHGGVELEQAYFDTRSLPAGLKLRGGKFLSGIGYLNDKHPHEWDFVDQNLPYRTLLGEHGLKDTGLQLTWRPKTGRLYTLLGVETLQGQDQPYASAGLTVPAVRADGLPTAAGNGGTLDGQKAGPRLWTAFAKLAPSLGDHHALQLGAWGGWASQHQEVHDHSDENPGVACGLPGGKCLHALQGKSRLWGLNAVYKFDAAGAYGAGDLALMAEYLHEVKDLKIAFHERPTVPVGAKRRFTQDGFYVQGVYGLAPRWQLGLRYDVTGLTNKVDGPAGRLRSWDDSSRWTLALTHHFSEFSRLRLQASRARLAVDGQRERPNELWIQYQHSLGAHGAHKF
ncbi:MAG: hypothetical protein RMK60_02190 [Burkholderiales bacterium]|nr:hypothetical protein [Burkholderiales bacterium]